MKRSRFSEEQIIGILKERAAGLRKGVKAGEVLDWLKQDFDLGRGHGMALVAMFKGKRD